MYLTSYTDQTKSPVYGYAVIDTAKEPKVGESLYSRVSSLVIRDRNLEYPMGIVLFLNKEDALKRLEYLKSVFPDRKLKVGTFSTQTSYCYRGNYFFMDYPAFICDYVIYVGEPSRMKSKIAIFFKTIQHILNRLKR